MKRTREPEQAVGLIEFLTRGGAELLMLRLLANGVVDKLFLLENRVDYQIDDKTAVAIYPLVKSSAVQNPFIKFLLIPYYAFVLSRKIRKDATVISMTHKSDIINIVSKLFIRHKSIVTIVVAPEQSYRGVRIFLLHLLQFLFKRFADLVVVNSRGIERYCEQVLTLPKSKLETIHNPISIAEVKQKSEEPLSKEETNIFSNGPVIITVGRLSWQKGQWHLLRIFKEVKKNSIAAKLVIIGDGALYEYLVSLSVALGLKTFAYKENDVPNETYDVYFIGSQENPYKFISRASLFAFTSFFEGFAYAISETLICGIPVISTDCRFGPREMLAPDTDLETETHEPEFAPYGILMPVLDGKQRSAEEPLSEGEHIWAETVRAFLDDALLLEKYSNVGIERVKEFDVTSIIPKWKRVLETVQHTHV